MDTDVARLPGLLDRVFAGQGRLDRAEIQRRAGERPLPPVLRRLVGALPDGDYDRDEAGRVLARIQREEGMWREAGAAEKLGEAEGETGAGVESQSRPSPEGRTGPQ